MGLTPFKNRLRESAALRYLFALALAAMALVAQLFFEWLAGANQPLAVGSSHLFLAAPALSSVLAGRRSGFTTLSFSTVLMLYFCLPPYHTFLIASPEVFIHLVLFVAVGVAICVGGGNLYVSHETLSSTLHSIGDGVVATDEKLAVTFMNPVAQSLSGWQIGHAKGKNIGEVLHLAHEYDSRRPVEQPATTALYRSTVTYLAGNTVLVSRNGRRTPIEDSAAPILGPSRKPLGAVMVFRDVSERRTAEQSLLESDIRYHFLADSVPECIFTCTAEGQCDYVNQRWSEYTGLAAGKTASENWGSAVHPDDLARTTGRWSEALRTGGLFEVEHRLRGKDFGYRSFLTRAFPMKDVRDKIAKWFVVSTDIEDVKRADARSLQARKLESVGLLAGGVAHDFNNLLTVINGYAGSALGQMAEDDPFLPAAQEILAAGERATGLVRQLLAFSRNQVFRPESVNLNEIASGMERLLSRLLGDDIEIVVKAFPTLEPTMADKHQIEQVIMNLAVNARDAMPHGGTLTFETRNVTIDGRCPVCAAEIRPGAYVGLSVRDTGTGIEPNAREHLFEPFFTTKPEGKGTGLGLATVHGVVMQSGGHVDVESIPGNGAAFHILLPVIRQEAAAATGGGEVEIRGGAETILLVEDDPDVRRFVAMALRRSGYRILEAAAGEEALMRYSAETFDLLVTDISMPKINGRELAARFRSLKPEIKVLLISGYDDSGESVAIPGAAFLAKPFSQKAIGAKIREVLGKPWPLGRVLIVDDDRAVRGFLRSVLEGAGYAVAEAENGSEALRRIEESVPDVAITDLVMPEREGIETIGEMSKKYPAMGVIAVSGVGDGTYLRVAAALGAHAHLPKPIDMQRLLLEVARLTARRERA